MCVRIYMSVNKYISVFVAMCISLAMYVYECMFVNICACLFVRVGFYKRVYMSACISVHINNPKIIPPRRQITDKATAKENRQTVRKRKENKKNNKKKEREKKVGVITATSRLKVVKLLARSCTEPE